MNECYDLDIYNDDAVHDIYLTEYFGNTNTAIFSMKKTFINT